MAISSSNNRTNMANGLSRWKLPILDSRPLTDLVWLLWLFPVWWVLGLEQFVWAVALLGIFLKVVIAKNGRIKISRTSLWLLILMLLYIVSSFAIIEPFRWLTYLRNYSAYLSAFLLLLIILNCVNEWRDVEMLLWAIVGMMAIASLFGVLGILEIWQPEFKSGLGYIMPNWIARSKYGGAIAFREIGHRGWFLRRPYFRLNSLFLFATQYASTLAFIIPVIIFLHQKLRGKQRALLKLILLIVVVNLLFTTARTAMLSLIAGGSIYFFLVTKKHSFLRYLLIPMITIAIIAIIGPMNIYTIISGAIDTLLTARGGGSLFSRLNVYTHTIDGIVERPLLGWGTERDIPGFVFPAGSHSYYLATLYRHGVLGFFALTGVLSALWIETRLPQNIAFTNRSLVTYYQFLGYGRWVLLIALFDGLTTAPITDSSTLIILWTIFSLLIIVKRLFRQEHNVLKQAAIENPQNK